MNSRQDVKSERRVLSQEDKQGMLQKWWWGRGESGEGRENT